MLQGLALLVQVADGTLSQRQANRKGNIPASQHKLTVAAAPAPLAATGERQGPSHHAPSLRAGRRSLAQMLWPCVQQLKAPAAMLPEAAMRQVRAAPVVRAPLAAQVQPAVRVPVAVSPLVLAASLHAWQQTMELRTARSSPIPLPSAHTPRFSPYPSRSR